MMQLQSILYPTKDICNIPELYYHKRDLRIDFNGYFNLFYIEKRKKYTKIQNLLLKVRLCGYHTLILVNDDEDIEYVPLDAKQKKEYCIKLPYEKYERGVFSFSLIEDDTLESKYIEGFYASEIENEQLQSINIGIDICTFRREAYINRNLRQIKEKILERNDLNVSDHIKIFIIDNGNTLEAHEKIQDLLKECRGRVQIVPNKNAGGAGGFTRGMIEILKAKEKEGFSHVLLMDDDAVVEPDTIVRIYGFLTTVKEEWKDITIGGAMLREDYPYMLFCAGEWWDQGTILNPHMHMDLRKYKNATCEYLTETGHEYDRYSGWWCCCYSLNTVRKDNLPIPLFIHHDDIEFGLRNKKQGIVFLNGVGVWHRGTELTFPGSTRYYDVRNNLIEISLHQKKNVKKAAMIYIFKALTAATMRLKYEDVLFIYRGVTDFLKGPKWLYKVDPEKLNSSIREMSDKMCSLNELKEKLLKEEYHMVEEQIKAYNNSFNMETILESRVRECHWWHILTYNGFLLPSYYKKVKVVFPTGSPFDTFRYNRVVMYEPGSGKALLLKKSFRTCIKMFLLQKKVLNALLCKFDEAAEDYRKNISKITNQEAWEKYLKEK